MFDPALREVTGAIKSMGLGDHAALAGVLHEVTNQGYLLASLDLFYFSGWATLLLIVACWLARRPAVGAAVAGGE